MLGYDHQIHETLKTIKQNDGFLGPVKPMLRAKLLISAWATVEVSPLTGMDVQWTLTAAGKKQLIAFNSHQRWAKKYKEGRFGGRWSIPYSEEAVVPLTIEVLDALKAIRERGEPETTRLDILARIQRAGSHGAKTVKGALGKDTVVYGALAEYRDGVWTLTDAGKRVEAGHIRKSECAQFSGKVR